MWQLILMVTALVHTALAAGIRRLASAVSAGVDRGASMLMFSQTCGGSLFLRQRAAIRSIDRWRLAIPATADATVGGPPPKLPDRGSGWHILDPR